MSSKEITQIIAIIIQGWLPHPVPYLTLCIMVSLQQAQNGRSSTMLYKNAKNVVYQSRYGSIHVLSIVDIESIPDWIKPTLVLSNTSSLKGSESAVELENEVENGYFPTFFHALSPRQLGVSFLSHHVYSFEVSSRLDHLCAHTEN